MAFPYPQTFASLLSPESDAPTIASAFFAQLANAGVQPGMCSVALTVSNGSGPYPIQPYGLTLAASGWSFQSTNTTTITLSSSSPSTLQFVVTQQGTAGAVVAGTTLMLYPQLGGITATALGTPTAGSGQGFPVANWNPNGSAAQMVRAFAAQFLPANLFVGALAGSSSLTTAQGNPNPLVGQSSNQTWLDLIAYSQYGVTRFPAATGQYYVTLSTVASGKGPYTVSPNGYWVTTGGQTYNSSNAAPITIPAGGSVSLAFNAAAPGSIYNASAWNTTGNTLAQITPLLGVVATSADYNSTSQSVIAAGIDTELDTHLITRCQTQWATLTTAATYQTIVNRALNADPTITSVYVDDQNPNGPGTFTVYVATAAGVYGSPATLAGSLAKFWPLECMPTVASATVDTLSASATVYVPAANVAAFESAAVAALLAYEQGLQIGDGITSQGTVYLSDLYGIFLAAGAAYLDITSPSGDVAPSAKGHVIRLSISPVIVPV